jgi:predicted membrane metal-binding protein
MFVAMLKRILRPIVKAVAGLAGVVFLFDNHLSGTAGFILLASIGLLTLCGIVWMIFLREDEDGSEYWRPRPRP